MHGDYGTQERSMSHSTVFVLSSRYGTRQGTIFCVQICSVKKSSLFIVSIDRQRYLLAEAGDHWPIGHFAHKTEYLFE